MKVSDELSRLATRANHGASIDPAQLDTLADRVQLLEERISDEEYVVDLVFEGETGGCTLKEADWKCEPVMVGDVVERGDGTWSVRISLPKIEEARE